MRFLWGRRKAEAEAPQAEETPEPSASEPADAADTPPAGAEPEAEPDRASGFFNRIASGLKRSSSRIGDEVAALFTKRRLDDAALEELEDVLLAADLGAGPAGRVVAALAKDKFDKEISEKDVRAALASVVAETLAPHERDFDLSGPAPQVVLFVGVNGSGKTTTLGKIAAMIVREGRRVVLAAGDTFRAAAVEQVSVWGERAGAPVVKRAIGADAAGLVFDAYGEAKAQNADVLLVDTAGRLQNKSQLMEELAKIV
ncbi:MAG: AAA family ATPase, partial [Caulobacterales bacterium]|nr:AAA family ATPase [Caulobacterales bacterium]